MTTEVVPPTIAEPASMAPPPATISEIPIAPAAVVTNGATAEAPTANGNGTPAAPAEAEAKAAPEPPKDPRAEPASWVMQQISPAMHVAAYHVADWVVKTAYMGDEAAKPSLPAAGTMTRRQFVDFFKDGTVLTRLANRFKPGAVEAPKDAAEAKSKEHAKHNLDGFTRFAREHLPESQVFASDDVIEKGKDAFAALFGTLFHLGQTASAKFAAGDLDVDAVLKELEGVTPKNVFQKIKDFVVAKTRRSSLDNKSNGVEKKANGIEEAPAAHQNGASPTAGIEAVEPKPNGIDAAIVPSAGPIEATKATPVVSSA